MVSELTQQINNDNLTKDEKLSFLSFLCGWMDKDNDKSYMIEMLKAYKSFHKNLLNTKYGKYAELRTTQLPNRLKYKHDRIEKLHIK